MASFQDLAELDVVIHQPTRLTVLTILAAVGEADFTYLLRETGTTRGNLSSHLSKLETAGFVVAEKTYRGKIPLTILRLTPEGRAKFAAYAKKLHRVANRLSTIAAR